jgi:DNA repair exonuclease SbcCD ATPase subunit
MSNSIVEYKSLLKVLLNLEAEYKIQQNTEKMINQYKTERDNKSKSLENLYSVFKNQISDRDFTNRLIEGLNIKLELSSKLESNKKLLEEKIIDKEEVDMDIKTINNKLQKSINEINNINIMSDKLKQIEAELMPITEAKKKAESQMEMLKSFKSEYATYKDQYNLLDILRKYSSPTAGSIQSLFMSIYMDKTLDMVNKLLGMIFNGQYQIARYVINENEFRIPFINANGMMVDDISGGSTSQVCIMGMIINLVLFTTGSTKYNIVSLDEIDGGLDHENRYLFVNILQQVCNMLNIDQLFIISHSVESALQAVDVVLLSDQEYYLNQFGAANVIYQYRR